MGIKIFNNLPPYIKDLSNNVRKFEMHLNWFLHTHSFYSIEEYIQLNLLQADNVSWIVYHKMKIHKT